MKPLPRRCATVFAAVITFFVFTNAAHAAVFISEVMYDPSGSDDVREWVEVTNDTSTSVDLNEWKLFEGGSNHKLVSDGARSVLQAGERAIIAANPSAFRADFPAYAGLVYDVSFTGGLNNTNGESLTLRDGALTDVNTVTYAPSVGAAGDGNSLQSTGSTWVAAAPTPGAPFQSGSAPSFVVQQSASSSSAQSQTQQNASLYASMPVPSLTVDLGAERVFVAGAPTRVEARVYAPNKERVQAPYVSWSLGDGTSALGTPALLTYQLPGEYVLVADASNGTYSGTGRMRIVVVAPHVAITAVTSEYVEIANHTTAELDIGAWQLRAGTSTFIFAPRTLVPARSAVKVPARAAKLVLDPLAHVTLHFPSGEQVAYDAARTALAATPLAVPTPRAAAPRSTSIAPAQGAHTTVDLTRTHATGTAESRSRIIRAWRALFGSVW